MGNLAYSKVFVTFILIIRFRVHIHQVKTNQTLGPRMSMEVILRVLFDPLTNPSEVEQVIDLKLGEEAATKLFTNNNKGQEKSILHYHSAVRAKQIVCSKRQVQFVLN